MRWLRSWPVPMPAHRAYVVDELERLVTSDYDYTPLGAWFVEHPEERGVCLIEWDIAVDPPQYQQFAAMAAQRPDEVLAAPQLLHHVEPAGSVYAHRRITPRGERWITEHDKECDYFAFGLIYMPREAVLAFLDAPTPARGAPLVTPGGYEDTRFTDQTFSMWYRHRYSGGGPVRVEWSVAAVHLHGRER